jgi:hypothetical protein
MTGPGPDHAALGRPLLCAICLAVGIGEWPAVTVAAGWAVCYTHRGELMRFDQGDTIERLLEATRPRGSAG